MSDMPLFVFKGLISSPDLLLPYEGKEVTLLVTNPERLWVFNQKGVLSSDEKGNWFVGTEDLQYQQNMLNQSCKVVLFVQEQHLEDPLLKEVEDLLSVMNQLRRGLSE